MVGSLAATSLTAVSFEAAGLELLSFEPPHPVNTEVVASNEAITVINLRVLIFE